MAGQKFCRLTVLHQDGKHNTREIKWLCRCDCGGEIRVRGSSLRSGNTRSCGCLQRKHGMSKTPEYVSYRDAKHRCRKTWRQDYPRYGGRGIEFRFDSFNQFYAELGPRPAGMTLDRIDNNGHYETGNVRWATPTQQRANQRPANRQHLKGRRHATAASMGAGWADIRIELDKLRAELATLPITAKRKPTLDELSAELAALESPDKAYTTERTQCEDS
jgi:hypothetical protein